MNKKEDLYLKLNDKERKLVEMYIAARQFKNAILEEEMIIIPSLVNNIKDGTMMQWGTSKVTFCGNKAITRIYPYIVNKSFSCEVYLKLILVELDFNFKIMQNYELHNLLKLFEQCNDEFKNKAYKMVNSKNTEVENKKWLVKELENVSDVFKHWRYIYEKINQVNEVNYGFLDSFCSFLDRYCRNLILLKYNYDVDTKMR